jgi:aspartyl-tRNA(Asn)/glutamyl-tRNA(Gln) amidotransferase subunit B
MRLEANISLSPLSVGELEKCGESGLPKYKTELKNINSFRFMEKAIAYEVRRQGAMLDAGQTPIQETRGWNEAKGQTFSQRVKEDAEDYRYFPDPDIPPIRFTEEQIDAWRAELPELPADRRRRWEQAGVEAKYSLILTEEKDVSDWVEEVFGAAAKVKIAPNEIAKALVNKRIGVDLLMPSKNVLALLEKNDSFESVSEEKLNAFVRDVLSENPEAVASFQSGKIQVIGYFIGQVQKKLGKKVNSTSLRSILEKQLEQYDR